jgi:hypothetical protein
MPVLRVPGNGREPDLNQRQLDARRRVHKALTALGGISSPAGSCVWHVVGLQRSVREWAIRQGWDGRPVRQEQAQGILEAALGVLGGQFGYCKPNGLRRIYLYGDEQWGVRFCPLGTFLGLETVPM